MSKNSPNQSRASWIASQNEAVRAEFYASLTPRERAFLPFDWDFWGRDDQKQPPGDWFVWLILAGRGWGKTRTAVECITRMLLGPTPLIAPPGAPEIMTIVADSPFDMRQYSIEGPSGFLHVGPQEYRPLHEPSKKTLTWPNGCKALLFSAEDPETLRGASGAFFWWDELAKSRYAQEGWDNMLFGMREGNPRGIVTTTPRPLPIIRELRDRPSTHVTVGSTWENKENLPPTFYREVIAPLEGTRLGRQEINAEILDESEGALWTRDMIVQVKQHPQLLRVLVGIDPPVAVAQQSRNDGVQRRTDENTAVCGIVVVGLGVDGRGYVLADYSGRMLPAQWGAKAVQAYDDWHADRIVAEGNQGGEMVRHTIQTVRANAPVTNVHAHRGKQARAEPVAALYEQRKVDHVGSFPELEDQMVTWEPLSGMASPDRLDALVWALTEPAIGGGPSVWKTDVANLIEARPA